MPDATTATLIGTVRNASHQPDLDGTRGPVDTEIDVIDCELSGELPPGLRGSFVRNGPNPLGPVNEAIQSMAQGRLPWGAAHHATYRQFLRHRVQIGVACEDLPEEHNRVTLDPMLKDSNGIPAPKIEYTISENTRAAVLEVASQDYVMVARAKGLSRNKVTIAHVLRNALLPVVTILGVQMGTVLAGSVVIESVFSWPGVGSLLFDSVSSRNYPVVLGIMVLGSLVVIAANIAVDLVYMWLDPRIEIR